MANEMTTQIAAKLQPATSAHRARAASVPSRANGESTPSGGNSTVTASQSNERRGRAGDAQDVNTAVREINDYVQNLQRELNFSYDKSAGRTVIKVTDSDGKVIRQIPPDEALALARHLRDVLDKDQAQGLLMKVKA